jgi:hypothetical protein
MSLILTDGKRIRFDLGHVLRERHLELIPKEKDEFKPMLEKWLQEFQGRWMNRPVDVTAMDIEISRMLLRAVELNQLRHVL